MVDEIALNAALRALHGHELEVWLRLANTGVNLGGYHWKRTLRYRELAKQCSPNPQKPLSAKTIQCAIRGLRRKGWLEMPAHPSRHTLTEFLLSIPQEWHVEEGPDRRAAYESFPAEHRELFLMIKNGLRTEQFTELEEEARRWLLDRGNFNTTTHRDKIDELIMRRNLGPVRAEECAQYFEYLYE